MQREYDRKFFIYRLEVINKVFFFMDGKVQNTGTMPWDNPKETESTDFRVGIMVFKHGLPWPPAFEGRSFFKDRCLKPGETADFSFCIDVSNVEPGWYTIKLNILKEHSYWFDDAGVLPDVLSVEIPHAGDHEKGDVKRLKHPGKAKIMYIAPTLPLYDQESGGRRSLELLRLLKEKGHEITFLCEAFTREGPAEKYLGKMESLGIPVFRDVKAFLSGLKGRDFDVCIIAWYECAHSYLNMIRAILPQAKIITDSVDVHWVRQERAQAVGELKISEEHKKLNKEIEKKAYAGSDEVWVVAESDKNEVLKEIPGCSLKIVSNIHRKHAKYIKDPSGDGVIFVGSYKHLPNESAALWGHEICRRFRTATGKKITYYIVGPFPGEKITALHNGKDTVVTGHVENITGYYKRSRVMLAPIKFGSGVKGKICHSICSGIPVITTDIGNEGLGLVDREEALIANSTDEFVDCLTRVFDGKIDLKAMNKKALSKILSIAGEQENLSVAESSLYYKPVVVVVMARDQKGLLSRCVDSILAKTSYANYKIAVLSNGCKDGTKEMMTEYRGKFKRLLDLHYNEKPAAFDSSVKYLIKKYPGYDIVFVDVRLEILTEKWLTYLYNAAYGSNAVKAVTGRIYASLGGEVRAPSSYMIYCKRDALKKIKDIKDIPAQVAYPLEHMAVAQNDMPVH